MGYVELICKTGKRAQAVSWFVYILKCADESLYTGITTDPKRRLSQHNNGTGAKYTRVRLPVEQVYIESAEDRSKATKREIAIKKMTRAAKIKLIAGFNPPS